MGNIGLRGRTFLRIGLVAAAALLVLCTAASGEQPLGREVAASVYRHVDGRGVVYFSDVPFEARPPEPGKAPPPGTEVSFEPLQSPPMHSGYDDIITRMSRLYRVRPALVKAVVAAESNFDPEAISRAGAQGLMQLMPATAESLGVRNPLSPEQNVAGGVRYLRSMLERYDDLDHALAAYNAGPTAVDRYRGIPPYPETQAYVRRVLNYYRGYHGEFRR